MFTYPLVEYKEQYAPDSSYAARLL
jgi:hypothetical protein